MVRQAGKAAAPSAADIVNQSMSGTAGDL